VIGTAIITPVPSRKEASSIESPHPRRVGSSHLDTVCRRRLELTFSGVVVLVLSAASLPVSTAAKLSVDPHAITLGDAVVVSWEVPSDSAGFYLSGIDSPDTTPQRVGRVVVHPRASTAFFLVVHRAKGVEVQSERVDVAGARGSIPQLSTKDLGCTLDLRMERPTGLDLVAKVKRSLQDANVAVDQEFLRDTSAVILQSRALAQPGGQTSGVGAREVIYQVAFGLNLAQDAAKGPITGVSVGSQLRFRRLQESRFEIDSDSNRCFETTRPIAAAIESLLKR
jgi:hypothetical protein